METIRDILKQHSFFKDLKPEYLDFIAGCASNVSFKAGEVILREGEDADKFYVIRHGKISIDIATSRHNSITIQTIKDGDILGWSWLIPPHKHRFNSRAIEDTRATALDGKCLRNKCEENHDLGYELLKRLAVVFTQRLETTRLQLLDMYNINAKHKE
ncbi:MAG: cyclic nucleotide-binding domain-containing protein [Candidatus Omnitrophota bacterium]